MLLTMKQLLTIFTNIKSEETDYVGAVLLLNIDVNTPLGLRAILNLLAFDASSGMSHLVLHKFQVCTITDVSVFQGSAISRMFLARTAACRSRIRVFLSSQKSHLEQRDDNWLFIDSEDQGSQLNAWTSVLLIYLKSDDSIKLED